jgi:polar amino acid transport system permease protein
MDAIIAGRTGLAEGLAATCTLFVLSGCIAIGMSTVAGVARLSTFKLVRVLATFYVEVFRGTSVVVQLFWLYFALPAFGISLSPTSAAVIALGLCFGAYGSEVVRGAILSVPKGQYEAAVSLNMTPLDRMRYVIFPQAAVAMIRPYTNILILLLKSTAAASLITMPELTFKAVSLNQVTFATTPIFITILLAYFLISVVISKSMAYLERRVGSWRLVSGI